MRGRGSTRAKRDDPRGRRDLTLRYFLFELQLAPFQFGQPRRIRGGTFFLGRYLDVDFMVPGL